MDKIITSVPINKAAGVVTSRSKDEYKPDKKLNQNQQHWEICPHLRKPLRNSPDLTGARFGNLTVLGLWGDRSRKDNNQRHAKWVCRCDCGHYEIRSAKVIKNPKNSKDCCAYCYHLDYLKRRDYYNRFGYNED